ncbi:MAG: GGDEF domain-containing protein [Pseudomonadota bacterium]
MQVGGEDGHKSAKVLAEEVASLRARLDERDAEIARLQGLVDIDPLLPLLNRRAFLREAERAWASSVRHGHGLAVIYLDIDGLKTINDAHGHAAGDAVLGYVCEVVTANMRAGDLAGRMGGDEFALLLTHLTSRQAETKAEELCGKIGAGGVPTDAGRVQVTATCGVCSSRGQATLKELLRTADERMLALKRAAR